MKKSVLFLLLVFTTALGFSQDTTNLAPFVGTWQWTEGNQTFTVELYITNKKFLVKDQDKVINGHYEMTSSNGLGMTYKSNKLLLPEVNYYYGHAIYGGSVDGILMHGSIDDNVLFNGDGNYVVRRGQLSLRLQDTCNGCPITAKWEVSKPLGLTIGNPRNFTIPTDLILTKVN